MISFPVSKKEKAVVLLIASKWRRPSLDKLMIGISDPYQWLTPTLILALCLIYIDWRSGIQALLLGAFSAAMADGINARYIKPNVDRIRPGQQFDEVESIGNMNKGHHSFPSNHAANTLAFTLALSLFFPGMLWFLLPFTLLVGYSRIYCGAHFPLDVIGGWVHGSAWVMLFYLTIFSRI